MGLRMMAFNVIVSGARTQNERDSQFKRPVHIFSWIEACFMFQFQAFPGSAVLRGRLHLFAWELREEGRTNSRRFFGSGFFLSLKTQSANIITFELLIPHDSGSSWGSFMVRECKFNLRILAQKLVKLVCFSVFLCFRCSFRMLEIT